MEGISAVTESWDACEDFMQEASKRSGMPYYAFITVTDRCNFKCIHCKVPRDPQQRLMTCSEIFSVIDQLADIGTLGLTITGGEPLTRPDFWKIIAHARKREFAIHLSTNGSLLTAEKAARLADFFPMLVFITIYGMNEETYRRVTGRSGMYRTVVRNIETLVKKGLPVYLRMSLLHENIAQVREVKKYASRLGVKLLPQPEILHRYDRCRDPLDVSSSKEQLENFFRGHPEYCQPKCNIFSDSTEMPCGAGRYIVAIGPHGEVMPCDLIRSGNASALKYDIREIIRNDPLFKQIRAISSKDLAGCIHCKFSLYCVPCPGAFFLENGTFTLPAIRSKCRIAKIRRRIHQEIAKH